MFSGKSCCCGCSDKSCNGNEFFYDDTGDAGGGNCPVCAIGHTSLAPAIYTENNWRSGETPQGEFEPMPGEEENLFVGEPCWGYTGFDYPGFPSSDCDVHSRVCFGNMERPKQYQFLSSAGTLPWSPQAFAEWNENWEGPLTPKGNCTMHCTEENIDCHSIAFVGIIGQYFPNYEGGHILEIDHDHCDYPQQDWETRHWCDYPEGKYWVDDSSWERTITLPPYSGENYENWEWIRQWVINGGKLVVMGSEEYEWERSHQYLNPYSEAWTQDDESNFNARVSCYANCQTVDEVVHPYPSILDDDGLYPVLIRHHESRNILSDFANFCAIKEDEVDVNQPINENNIFYYAGDRPQERKTNHPFILENDKIIPCCQQTTQPFRKSPEDSGGNSLGALPLSFSSLDAWALHPVNDGVGIVGTCSSSLLGDASPACTVVYKQNGKGAVVVVYDSDVWGLSAVSRPEEYYDSIDNGLSNDENKLLQCNNDFWKFLCEDFLEEEGYTPSSACDGPEFWDNMGPEYEGNECLPKHACCLPDGTCQNLNVWECTKIPLSTYHGCLRDTNVGTLGWDENNTCSLCEDLIEPCEVILKGACCDCPEGGCPEPGPTGSTGSGEPPDDTFGIGFGDSCWPTPSCSSISPDWDPNDTECCAFYCRGWYWEDSDGDGPEEFGPHHTTGVMGIPSGIIPSLPTHQYWMKQICEDNAHLYYTEVDGMEILQGATGYNPDTEGQGAYGIMTLEPCFYDTFSHYHPWPGWTGDYESIHFQWTNEVQDSRPNVNSYTCGFWDNEAKTCRPPEEHPDWDTLEHGHPGGGWIEGEDGELTHCNGSYTDENDEIVMYPPCGYPLDYGDWGCDGCCTPYGTCCTGTWKANEPLNDDGSSPPYEVGIGSTADGRVTKTGCDIRRQFDCDTYRGNQYWIGGTGEYSYGTKWTVEIIDGVERQYWHEKLYRGLNIPTLPGLTYDVWMVNEWHGITEGSPNCDDGTSWLPYEVVDDIILGEGATGSICHHCEHNGDCKVEGECCMSDNKYYDHLPRFQRIKHTRMCRPCWPEGSYGVEGCTDNTYTAGGSYFNRNPYGCPCESNNDCCQCQSTDPDGVGITGANNYDENCECNCKCQASDPDGENYSPLCLCEGETGENKPYCTMNVPDKWGEPGNWPIKSDYKCVECLSDIHCDADQCCDHGTCKDPEEVSCFSDDDCCSLAPCCSTYPSPCDGIDDPKGTCSVCQECETNDDCFNHHCCNLNGKCGPCIACSPGITGGCSPGAGWNDPCDSTEQCSGDLCCRSIVPGEIHGRCWDCEGVDAYVQPCEPCGYTGSCCVYDWKVDAQGATYASLGWRCHDGMTGNYPGTDGDAPRNGLRWEECRSMESWNDSDENYHWHKDKMCEDLDGEEGITCGTPPDDTWYSINKSEWDGGCLPCESNCPHGFYCSPHGPTGTYASGLTGDPRVCLAYDDFCWGNTGATGSSSACSNCRHETIPERYSCEQCEGGWTPQGNCVLGCSSTGFVISDGSTGACCLRGYGHPHYGICDELTYEQCKEREEYELNFGEPDIAWYGPETACEDVKPKEGKLCPEGYCCDCDNEEHNHPPTPTYGWTDSSGEHGPLWPSYSCSTIDKWCDTFDNDEWAFTELTFRFDQLQQWQLFMFPSADYSYCALNNPHSYCDDGQCCNAFAYGNTPYPDCSVDGDFWSAFCDCTFDTNPFCMADTCVCEEQPYPVDNTDIKHCGHYRSPELLSSIASWSEWDITNGSQLEDFQCLTPGVPCLCVDAPCADSDCEEEYTCKGACSTELGACCSSGLAEFNNELMSEDEWDDSGPHNNNPWDVDRIQTGRMCRVMSRADCERKSILWNALGSEDRGIDSPEYYGTIDEAWPWNERTTEADYMSDEPFHDKYRRIEKTYFYSGMWCDEIPKDSPCMDYAEQIKCHECNHDGDCLGPDFYDSEKPSCGKEFIAGYTGANLRKCQDPTPCTIPTTDSAVCEAAGNICEEDQRCCANGECVGPEEPCVCENDCDALGIKCCPESGDCRPQCDSCESMGKCCGDIMHEYNHNDDYCTREKKLRGLCCNGEPGDGYYPYGEFDVYDEFGCEQDQTMAPIRVWTNVCTDCKSGCYADPMHTGSLVKRDTTMFDEEYYFIQAGHTEDESENRYRCCSRCSEEEPTVDDWHYANNYSVSCEDQCITEGNDSGFDPYDSSCSDCECLFEQGFECPDTGTCFDHKCYPRWPDTDCDGGGCGATGECIPASWQSYVKLNLEGLSAGFPEGEWISKIDIGLGQHNPEWYVGLTERLEGVPPNGSICVPLDRPWVGDRLCNDCGSVRVNKNEWTGNTGAYYHGQTGPYSVGDPCTFNHPDWGGHWLAGSCMKHDGSGECGPCPDFCNGCGPCMCDEDEECDEGKCCLNHICKRCFCELDEDCPEDDMCCEDNECVFCECESPEDCEMFELEPCCEEGKCVQCPCEQSEDCIGQQTCCVDGDCIFCECEFDEDCPEEQVCVDRECWPIQEVDRCFNQTECWVQGMCCNETEFEDDLGDVISRCGPCDIGCEVNENCPYGFCCWWNEDAFGGPRNECVDCTSLGCPCVGEDMYEYECCMQTFGGCWKEEKTCSDGCGPQVGS